MCHSVNNASSFTMFFLVQPQLSDSFKLVFKSFPQKSWEQYVLRHPETWLGKWFKSWCSAGPEVCFTVGESDRITVDSRRAENTTDWWEDWSSRIYIWTQWDNICCSVRGHTAVRLSGGEKVVGWSRARMPVSSNRIATRQREKMFSSTEKWKCTRFLLWQQIQFHSCWTFLLIRMDEYGFVATVLTSSGHDELIKMPERSTVQNHYGRQIIVKLTRSEQNDGLEAGILSRVDLQGLQLLHLLLEDADVVHEGHHALCWHGRCVQARRRQQRGHVKGHGALGGVEDKELAPGHAQQRHLWYGQYGVVNEMLLCHHGFHSFTLYSVCTFKVPFIWSTGSFRPHFLTSLWHVTSCNSTVKIHVHSECKQTPDVWIIHLSKPPPESLTIWSHYVHGICEQAGQKRRSCTNTPHQVITGGSVHAASTWNKGLSVKKPSARTNQSDEGFIVGVKVIKITRGPDKLRYDRKKYAFNMS